MHSTAITRPSRYGLIVPLSAPGEVLRFLWNLTLPFVIQNTNIHGACMKINFTIIITLVFIKFH